MIFGTISAIVALLPKTNSSDGSKSALRPDLTEVGWTGPTESWFYTLKKHLYIYTYQDILKLKKYFLYIYTMFRLLAC